jgi:hypothetical protein
LQEVWPSPWEILLNHKTAILEASEIEKEERDLIAEISSTESHIGEVASTILKTDQRVIARVTDGIYRQPGSALRELISNAYDADATKVIIKTDAPRFDEMTIEDNGIGMSKAALVRTLLHIGGSAKRQEFGSDYGITNAENPNLSPGGRPLIGKIGIGMFSVSQLTHTFQIITKVKGDNFRTIATVAMRQYADDVDVAEEFESGKVNLWREPAADVESQGTTIVLTGIKPHAKNLLRSKELWLASENTSGAESDRDEIIHPPKYHIGRVDDTGDLLENTKSVPWETDDSPKESFTKLVDCVWDEYNIGNVNPMLEKLFDNYLNMVWQLSLSIPTSYVKGHIFDMDLTWTRTFKLSNLTKGGATEVSLVNGVPVRQTLGLEENSTGFGFQVIIDDLLLSRPIIFKGLPKSSHAIKTPLVFIGKCREEFKGVPRELTGGPLSFEAYLFWNPKIAPTEHRGSLIRIHGASGASFDSSWMRYQVSEQTRTRQTICEIYVQEGFDSALNIDRESFNYAHPHAVYLTKWVHSALRQLATAQKKIAKEIRDVNRNEATDNSLNEIQQIALQVHQEETNDVAAEPPTIEFVDAQTELIPNTADIIFETEAIIPKASGRQTGKTVGQNQILNQKIKAIAQLLATFGVLENLSKEKQQRLLKAIYQILDAAD